MKTRLIRQQELSDMEIKISHVNLYTFFLYTACLGWFQNEMFLCDLF